MSGFTKLVPEIIQSSIWNEPSDVRIVWITMLAVKDAEGYVRGDSRTIARLANVSVESTEKALSILQSPDAMSHTPDNDGRRISPLNGGWVVLNHDLYRCRDEKAEHAAYVKRWRHGSTKPRDGGYVYFLGISNAIKIGYSVNPWARSNEIVCCEKPELMAVISGTTDDERGLHEKFKEFRMNGEWFKRSEELVNHIMSLRSKYVNHPSASVSASTSEEDKSMREGTKRFVVPTPQEVEAYSNEIGYPLNGAAWCDSYAQKGWMVGKNKMKDWKAAVRNWKSQGWKPSASNNKRQPLPVYDKDAMK